MIYQLTPAHIVPVGRHPDVTDAQLYEDPNSLFHLGRAKENIRTITQGRRGGDRQREPGRTERPNGGIWRGMMNQTLKQLNNHLREV
jgi:hypothetical protein